MNSGDTLKSDFVGQNKNISKYFKYLKNISKISKIFQRSQKYFKDLKNISNVPQQSYSGIKLSQDYES